MLDGESPTVTVLAAYSKRRCEDTLPLRAELAEALRARDRLPFPPAHVHQQLGERRRPPKGSADAGTALDHHPDDGSLLAHAAGAGDGGPDNAARPDSTARAGSTRHGYRRRCKRVGCLGGLLGASWSI